MGQYDLTPTTIASTYTRLMQTVSGSQYDGLGNLLALTASLANTASLLIGMVYGTSITASNGISCSTITITNGGTLGGNFVGGTFTSPTVNGGNLNGANINSTVIGNITPAAGTFINISCSNYITASSISCSTVSITNGGFLSGNFLGGTFTSPTINGGNLNGANVNSTIIGNITPAAATFTTVNANLFYGQLIGNSNNSTQSLFATNSINATSASYAISASYASNVNFNNLSYRAGQQSIGNLATTQIIIFSLPLSTSSYAVSLTPDTALAAALAISSIGQTNAGFTASLSAGVSGGFNLAYIAWLYN